MDQDMIGFHALLYCWRRLFNPGHLEVRKGGGELVCECLFGVHMCERRWGEVFYVYVYVYVYVSNIVVFGMCAHANR